MVTWEWQECHKLEQLEQIHYLNANEVFSHVDCSMNGNEMASFCLVVARLSWPELLGTQLKNLPTVESNQQKHFTVSRTRENYLYQTTFQDITDTSFEVGMWSKPKGLAKAKQEVPGRFSRPRPSRAYASHLMPFLWKFDDMASHLGRIWTSFCGGEISIRWTCVVIIRWGTSDSRDGCRSRWVLIRGRFIREVMTDFLLR